VETAEMRRSTLQRKDREELTLIATTLGRKPSSRARKGEIIDLILDLAAGGDGDAVAEPEPEPETETDSGAGDDATSTDDSGTSDPSERDEADGEEEADGSQDATSSDSGRSGDDDARDESTPAREETSEPGNRKRRRRGRERENNKDSNEQWDGEPIAVAGYLELRSEGYGFLRVDGVLPSKDDAYVPVKMVRLLSLRKGDHVTGTSRPANRNEKNPAIMEIQSVNGGPPDSVTDRVEFEALPAVYPDEPIVLAGTQEPADATARVIDTLTPIGKGQRALLAAGPRTGKTTLLQHVIRSLETNHPDIELLVLLLDERPEDITEMKRWVDRGDVIASPFDRPADEQVTIAEMVIERAKRVAESGKDVVVVADGISRLARAYAQEAASGRSGVSIDATSIHPAKRFLSAARKLEGGGSLTMIATITVDSDSAVDTLIYDELAGTANLELRLDRAAAVRRVFPAVDIEASSTVHEEFLRDDKELDEVRTLRRELAVIAADPTQEPSADLQALLAKIAAE
jgi:transcription termination factor Rho